MILLVLGVALWWAAHLFQRVAPDMRASMGNMGKAVVSVVLLVSIVLMVLGYRMSDGAFFWGPSPATVGINNLAILFALYLSSPGPKKGALFYRMRHPQLTGFLLWALAHVLVNGDVASFILFGGLAVWAVVEMGVINRAEPEWSPPEKGSLGKDAMFLAASAVLMVVIGYIHYWLGYWPFSA